VLQQDESQFAFKLLIFRITNQLLAAHWVYHPGTKKLLDKPSPVLLSQQQGYF
jgi:hypothetical protein